MAGEMGGIGIGDAMLLAQRGGGGGYGGYGMDGGAAMWNNPLMWVFAMGLMNNGWGGYGGGGANGVITRAELQAGFNDQDTRAGIRGIQQGICDSTYALNNSIQQGFTATQHAISDCCCNTNQNIERSTCAITNAIHEEGANTRALINANTMDALREKVSEKDRELQSAQFQLSQLSQNATLINALRPTPVPAYLAVNPYQAVNMCGCSGNYGTGWAA